MEPDRVVDAWLEFIDTLYPRYRRGLVEQYGVSLLLQRSTEVRPCSDEVVHYWAQKDDYVAAIRRELDRLRALPPASALAHLRANRIALPPPARRRHQRMMLRSLAPRNSTKGASSGWVAASSASRSCASASFSPER